MINDNLYAEITMRRARMSDRARIEAFQAAALRIHAKHHYKRHQIDRYIVEVGTMPADMLSDGRLFILEYRGDIIATGGWRWQVDDGTATTGIETDRTDQPGIFRGTHAEIAAIYVDPFLARIGLASWLIATLEADIARLGLREVRIAATMTGLSMCQKNGYRPYRIARVPLSDGTDFPTIAVAKALSARQSEHAARTASLLAV